MGKQECNYESNSLCEKRETKMKTFDKIMKGSIIFVGLLFLLAVLPLPMRCHQTAQSTSRINIDVVDYWPARFDCYSPLHREFWLEDSWDIKFVGLNFHQDAYPGHSETIVHP